MVVQTAAALLIWLACGCTSDDVSVGTPPSGPAGADDSAGTPPSGPVGGYGGLTCGDLDAEYPGSPAELAARSDVVVVAPVVRVHPGRSDVDDLDQISLADFFSVLLELDPTQVVKGGPIPDTLYVEIEVCDIVTTGPSSAAEVAASLPPANEAVWFLIDASDWQPLPGQVVTWVGDSPGAGADRIFGPEVAGIVYEGSGGTAEILHSSSIGELGPGWDRMAAVPARDFVSALISQLDAS